MSRDFDYVFPSTTKTTTTTKIRKKRRSDKNYSINVFFFIS